MANTIQVRRGANASLPTLNAGEFGFSTDTKQTYIGDGTVNYEIATGLAIHAGRNNEANKLVRTDGSGYLNVEYINTNTTTENPTIANFITDNGDGYHRKSSLAHVINTISSWGVLRGGYIRYAGNNTADRVLPLSVSIIPKMFLAITRNETPGAYVAWVTNYITSIATSSGIVTTAVVIDTGTLTVSSAGVTHLNATGVTYDVFFWG